MNRRIKRTRSRRKELGIDISFETEITDELCELVDYGVRRAVMAAANEYRIRSYEVSVLIVDDIKIKSINAEQRGIDSPTDVLSFPQFESLRAIKNADFPHLGDIVISIETAERQSKEYGHSFEREVCYLTVHSMLHLLGYDHMNERDKFIMRTAEKRIMSSMGVYKANE